MTADRSTVPGLIAPVSLIDAVWETRAPSVDAGGAVRVLPDGCVDLLWHEGSLRIAGPDRRAYLAPFSAGAVSCGVRFRPGAARAMFGVAGEALAGGAQPASGVLGADDAARLDAALAAAAPGARPALLRRWAGARIASGAARDPAVAAVADALSMDPTMRVAALADRVGYSERQLRRRVQAEVGYGPKLLARVLRLQRVLRLAREDRSGALSLADLASVGGFVDQAHLSHESADLGGVPASVLLGR